MDFFRIILCLFVLVSPTLFGEFLPIGVGGGSINISQGPFSDFVFRPGQTGTNLTGGNIYSCWSGPGCLYNDFSKIKGTRNITFNDSSGTVTIPAGSWDVGGATIFTGKNNVTDLATVHLANGCVFTSGMPAVITGLRVISDSSAPVATYAGLTQGFVTIYLDSLGSLAVTAGSPMIVFDASSGAFTTAAILLKTGSTIDSSSGSAGQEVVKAINGALVFLYLEELTEVKNFTLASDVASEFVAVYGAASGKLDPVQTNALGAIASSLSEAAVFVSYSDSATNLGASDVQNAIASLAKRVAPVDADVTVYNNTSTTETTLATYTLPAVSLSSPGDRVRIRASGTFAATINTKTLKLYFGSNVILTSGGVAFNGANWLIDAEILHISNGHQLANARLTTSSALLTDTVNVGDPAQPQGGPIVIKVTGQSGTASNDVTQKSNIIELVPVI